MPRFGEMKKKWSYISSLLRLSLFIEKYLKNSYLPSESCMASYSLIRDVSVLKIQTQSHSYPWAAFSIHFPGGKGATSQKSIHLRQISLSDWLARASLAYFLLLQAAWRQN